MTAQTFYFNTGVRPENNSSLFGRQVWKGGTKQIPFTCNDVPNNFAFCFACDKKDLPESKLSNFIVREITDNGPDGLLSKFAYFKKQQRL